MRSWSAKNPNEDGIMVRGCLPATTIGAYDRGRTFLLKAVMGNIYPTMLIELGYNYTLQEMPERQPRYYNAALQKNKWKSDFGLALAMIQNYACWIMH